MLIVVDKVSKYYVNKQAKIYANKNISLYVENGEILGILGPNGAGKTTLIKQIVNLLIPDSGRILFKGEDVVRNPSILRGRVSILLEGFKNIYPYLTGRANLLYFAYLNGVPDKTARERADKLLKDMRLYDFKDIYSFEYSFGMNKKLSIASCLINEPELVILDEPTSGLDIVAVEELIDFINKISNSGKTFIIVSHDMRFIEKVTKRVIYIKDGEIKLDGDTSRLKNSYGVKEVTITLEKDERLINFLNQNHIKFDIKKDLIMIELNITDSKNVLIELLTSFNLLNIEKRDSDFEKIFKDILKE